MKMRRWVYQILVHPSIIISKLDVIRMLLLDVGCHRTSRQAY